MLEVVFSDSAKGSMRMAKRYDAEQIKAGPTTYFGEKPSAEMLEKMFAGRAVGGRSDEVVVIGFNLDVGDIAGAVDGEGRKAEFVRMLARVEVEADEVDSFFEMQGEDVRRLVEYAEQGEGFAFGGARRLLLLVDLRLCVMFCERWRESFGWWICQRFGKTMRVRLKGLLVGEKCAQGSFIDFCL